MGFLYSIDNPTMPACILPSMHVLVSLVLAAAVLKADCMRGKPAVKTGACVLSILSGSAKVFIIHESIIDVYVACALFVPIYLIVYHFCKTKTPPDPS